MSKLAVIHLFDCYWNFVTFHCVCIEILKQIFSRYNTIHTIHWSWPSTDCTTAGEIKPIWSFNKSKLISEDVCYYNFPEGKHRLEVKWKVWRKVRLAAKQEQQSTHRVMLLSAVATGGRSSVLCFTAQTRIRNGVQRAAAMPSVRGEG